MTNLSKLDYDGWIILNDEAKQHYQCLRVELDDLVHYSKFLLKHPNSTLAKQGIIGTFENLKQMNVLHSCDNCEKD